MKRYEIDKKMVETIAMLVEAVNELKDNHIPHIQTRIDKIDERMWAGGATIITILIGILVTLLWK